MDGLRPPADDAGVAALGSLSQNARPQSARTESSRPIVVSPSPRPQNAQQSPRPQSARLPGLSASPQVPRPHIPSLPQSARQQPHDPKIGELINSASISPPQVQSDLERWRLVFKEETANCISALQQVVQSSDINRLAIQFSEERRADTATIAELQERVNSLLQVNCAQRQTTIDMLNKDDLAQMTKCLDKTVKTIGSLLLQHKKHWNTTFGDLTLLAQDVVQKSAASAAEETQGKVISEMSRAWQQLQKETDSASSKHWDIMNSQLEALNLKFQQSEGTAHSHHQDLEKHLMDAVSGVSEKLSAVTELISKESNTLEVVRDKLTAAHHTSFDKLHSSISGSFDLVPGQIRKEIQALGDLSGDADRAASLQAELDQVRKQAATMEVDLSKARAALKECSYKMHDSASCAVLASISDIERRGNVSIDIRTGDVEILKGMDFVPRKSSDKPTAEFVNPTLASEVLQDIVAIQKTFAVPMTIEGHTKGGESFFWETLAINRSKSVMEKLELQGVAKEVMVAKGLPGKKGLNRACMVIRLDIFPDRD